MKMRRWPALRRAGGDWCSCCPRRANRRERGSRRENAQVRPEREGPATPACRPGGHIRHPSDRKPRRTELHCRQKQGRESIYAWNQIVPVTRWVPVRFSAASRNDSYFGGGVVVVVPEPFLF